MTTLGKGKQLNTEMESPREMRREFVTGADRVLAFYIGRTYVGWYAVTELGELLVRMADDAADAEQQARAQLAAKHGPEADPTQLRRVTAWVRQ